MVTCAKCGGASKVVESRYVVREPQLTKIRTRQCKACRWKWKTIEVHFKDKK